MEDHSSLRQNKRHKKTRQAEALRSLQSRPRRFKLSQLNIQSKCYHVGTLCESNHQSMTRKKKKKKKKRFNVPLKCHFPINLFFQLLTEKAEKKKKKNSLGREFCLKRVHTLSAL